MSNEINLVFDKSTTRLAGNPYGKSVYREQIERKIDYNKKNIIVFPNNIEKVASSFIQGLFSEIVKNIGYVGISEKIELKSRTEELTKEMYEDLID